MSKLIGKKIRELRKELKLTQSELAEPEMTKSMLSHIENGTANPSMKNLQYLAGKLNKPVAYFLEEEVLFGNEIKKDMNDSLSMDEILKILDHVEELIKLKDFKVVKNELNELLNSHKFNEKGKLYADIIYRLALTHLSLNEFEEGEVFLNKCIDVYIGNTLYVEATRSQLLFLKKMLYYHNYLGCSEVLERVWELYGKSSSKDVFLEIEILSKEPLITIAQGDFERTVEVCEKAIALSNENNIYYLTDLIYRNMAITYLLQGQYKKFLINIDKAKKYVSFTNNKYILARIYQNYAMYENMMKNPLKALEALKVYEENTDERAFYYYLELARAQYLLGQYDDAMESLMKINHEEKIFYLIDCIYILNSLVLKGLILSKFKNYDKAIESINKAIDGIKFYINIEYEGCVRYAYKELSLAYDALSEVYSQCGDYEKAFLNLKQANEFKELCSR